VQNQVLAGRPVIGASVSVPDLAKVRQILTQAEIEPWVGTEGGERIVVEPRNAQGMWLEFRRGS
jgi:hypothetical protein